MEEKILVSHMKYWASTVLRNFFQLRIYMSVCAKFWPKINFYLCNIIKSLKATELIANENQPVLPMAGVYPSNH